MKRPSMYFDLLDKMENQSVIKANYGEYLIYYIPWFRENLEKEFGLQMSVVGREGKVDHWVSATKLLDRLDEIDANEFESQDILIYIKRLIHETMEEMRGYS